MTTFCGACGDDVTEEEKINCRDPRCPFHRRDASDKSVEIKKVITKGPRVDSNKKGKRKFSRKDEKDAYGNALEQYWNGEGEKPKGKNPWWKFKKK